MLTSFPMSFYFSKQINIDKKNANKYLMRNMAMSTAATLIFVYTLWKRGKCEEELSKKYLYFFSNFELENFDVAGT